MENQPCRDPGGFLEKEVEGSGTTGVEPTDLEPFFVGNATFVAWSVPSLADFLSESIFSLQTFFLLPVGGPAAGEEQLEQSSYSCLTFHLYTCAPPFPGNYGRPGGVSKDKGVCM